MTEHVADELALRTLVARYADAVCRKDVPAWRATWAEDGEWQVLGTTVRGRDAVVAYYESIVSGLEAVVQHAHGGIIEFDSENRHALLFIRIADGGSSGRLYSFPSRTPGAPAITATGGQGTSAQC